MRDTARGQLDLLSMSVRAELDGLDKSLRAQAASLAEMPGVQAALAASAPDALSEMLLPYVNRARHALALTSLELEVVADAQPGDSLGSSVAVCGGGVLAAAHTPVRRGGQPVGRVEARALVWERLSSMELPVGMGMALVSTGADGAARALHQRGTLADLGAPLPAPDTGMTRGDDCYAMSLGLGEGVRAVLSYDTSRLNESRWNKINLFIWFFMGGGLCLWIVLLLNVMRIERFFSRLKKIIISSHSNYFGERFESDNVHCLDVMHCHNEECPVYQNPSLTCYLETGSEAISPRWRDTCVYLNKYESCRNCPVYVMRKGDELTEMRNVVNTMMRLWGEFLGRVGHLLTYVLRSQGKGGGGDPLAGRHLRPPGADGQADLLRPRRAGRAGQGGGLRAAGARVQPGLRAGQARALRGGPRATGCWWPWTWCANRPCASRRCSWATTPAAPAAWPRTWSRSTTPCSAPTSTAT